MTALPNTPVTGGHTKRWVQQLRNDRTPEQQCTGKHRDGKYREPLQESSAQDGPATSVAVTEEKITTLML